MLSALRAHTKSPYKIDLLWEMLGALKDGARGPDRAQPQPARAGEAEQLRAVSVEARLRQPRAAQSFSHPCILSMENR